MSQYTVAICPPKEVIQEMKSLKQDLRQKIGWYSASNSEAHITLDFFPVIDDLTIGKYKTLLKKFCAQQKSLRLGFHSFSAFYESRTVFAQPDEDAEAGMKGLFLNYTKMVKLRGILEHITPHMTVGKGLKTEQFKTALDYLSSKQINIWFDCTNIALRRFNPIAKQYEITDRFYFVSPTK